MRSARQNVEDSATHRVWQTLPRFLRRRAASHDVRRVPVRLRQKAKAEVRISSFQITTFLCNSGEDGSCEEEKIKLENFKGRNV